MDEKKINDLRSCESEMPASENESLKQNTRNNTVFFEKKPNDPPLSFDDIMKFWPSNRTVFSEIKKNISDIVPMIGAGMSQNITREGESYPTWERLLRDYAEKLGPKEKSVVEWELDASNYEEAAEKVAAIVGEKPLLTYIKQQFSKDKIDEEKLNESAIAEVVKLFPSGLILTTNYDKAIEVSFYKFNGEKSLEILLPSSKKRDFVRVARKNSDLAALYKFHGDIDRGWEDIILTKSSYDKAYGNGGDTELDRNLSFCLLTHPILFLGCSLAKDRILQLLLDNKEGVHFAFVACGNSNRQNFNCEEAAAEAIKKAAELDRMGVMPVFYPRFDRSCINELLKELRKKKITKEELKPADYLYIQVSDNKKNWIHDSLQKLAKETKQIVFFGGIISTLRKFHTTTFKTDEERLKTEDNYKALNHWLLDSDDAQLFFCYDYGEAAKNRALQVKTALTQEKTKEKIEEILNIPNAFDEKVRSRIYLIPLTYTLTGYPIIMGKDLYWNIILDGRSSSESVLQVRESAIEKYRGYMRFALQVSRERLEMIKSRIEDESDETDDFYWECMCTHIFDGENYEVIQDGIRRLEQLFAK